MSHIAAALAKSKGKVVTPPSESGVAASTPGLGVSAPPILTDASAAPVRKSRTPLFLALAALVVGGGALVWWLGRSAPAPTAIVLPPPKPAAPPPNLPAAVAANKQDQAAVARDLGTAKPVAPTVAPVPAPAAPPADFHDVVRQFAIAAVAEGPNGRAMIDGKLHRVGAEVVPGLWLREIRGGRLIFGDAQGHEYPRRF